MCLGVLLDFAIVKSSTQKMRLHVNLICGKSYKRENLFTGNMFSRRVLGLKEEIGFLLLPRDRDVLV